MNTATEILLKTPQGQVAGLRWPAADGPRVLCLHGWLDNAASFVPLSGYLPRLDLVAVDLPGHGHSDHRHSGARYYFSEYLWDVDLVLDALGWPSCHLVGHSMGAAVASMFAAAAPERVRSLVMLDALGPITEPAEGSAVRLQKSMRSFRRGLRNKKAYNCLEDMIKARQKANADLGDEAARLICERSAQPQDGHYQWSDDSALHWISPVMLTEGQALDYLRQIQAPVLSLSVTPFAPHVDAQKLKARSAAMPHGRHELLSGHHHFHMEQPEPVAATIRSFIAEHDHAPEQQP